MNLANLMNEAQSPAKKAQPLVVVMVEYYRDGTIHVHCNAGGEKVGEMMEQILEGALAAVRNGEKREAS